jgi:hypothetical protein
VLVTIKAAELGVDDGDGERFPASGVIAVTTYWRTGVLAYWRTGVARLPMLLPVGILSERRPWHRRDVPYASRLGAARRVVQLRHRGVRMLTGNIRL